MKSGDLTTEQEPASATQELRPVQAFWLYKRGQLVLLFSSEPGVLIPTRGPIDPAKDPFGLMEPCAFASGQFMSVEWEPRVRRVVQRAADLVELIELLEDRRYEIDLEPPSQRVRRFKSL